MIPYDKEFCITSVCKNDLFQEIHGKFADNQEVLQPLIKIVENLSEQDMENIASLMAEAYTSNDFWVHLCDIMDDHYFADVKK